MFGDDMDFRLAHDEEGTSFVDTGSEVLAVAPAFSVACDLLHTSL